MMYVCSVDGSLDTSNLLLLPEAAESNTTEAAVNEAINTDEAKPSEKGVATPQFLRDMR